MSVGPCRRHQLWLLQLDGGAQFYVNDDGRPDVVLINSSSEPETIDWVEEIRPLLDAGGYNAEPGVAYDLDADLRVPFVTCDRDGCGVRLVLLGRGDTGKMPRCWREA